MGDVIKLAKSEYGKGSKSIKRAGRDRVHNASVRPAKILRARKRHLKNALRSCGEKFANELSKYYGRNYSPGQKAGHKNSKGVTQ